MLIQRFGRTLIAFAGSMSILVAMSSAQALNCSGTSASDNPSARAEIDHGVESYTSARYEDAISHFAKAIDLAPCLTLARMYLATAQAQNVVPGLDTPDNLNISAQAIANFQIVLTQDPHSVNSLKQVASIYFSIKKLDEAREWQMKVLAEDPKDTEAAYTIGVIDWTQAYQHVLVELAKVGLQDDGEGNRTAPADVLESIAQQNSALVAEALKYLVQAIEGRPDYDDAMAYINLVYRRKADIDHQNAALRDQDLATAKDWARKAMLTRKENEEKKIPSPDSSQP